LTQPVDSPDRLTADEVRARATTGAAMLGSRGVLIYTVGIGANLLLASLLAPRDFGLFALGTVLVVFGIYVAQGGFGAALIRREETPSRLELEAVLGVQLGLTALVTCLAFALGASFGRDGLVVATMVASLPCMVLRTPSLVVLEQRLRYREIAIADVIEAFVYYAWACGAVLLGFGVWGLATGVVARAMAGSVAVTALGPVGLVLPRWSWRTVRPIVGFGARFQAAEALSITREQGLNVLVAAVAGLGTLGIWNLAWRVIQIPNLFLLGIGRVAFPAMSRIVAAGRDARPIIERLVAVLAALTGLLVAGLVGSSVALPAIVGEEWGDVPAVILWSGIGFILASPIASATRGYLFVRDQAGTVAKGLVASGAVWFGVSAALLPELGAPAVGVGWVLAGIVNSAVLWRRTAQLSGAAILARVSAPVAVAVAATGGAWLAAHAPHDRLVGGLVGLVVGEALVLGGLLVVSRAVLRDTLDLVRQSVAGLHARGPSGLA
jgi:O-antigen/teichoic acid export membrane protein